jgi:chromosome segregation ATPase
MQMSQAEAQNVIKEVVSQLRASLEPRFDRIDERLNGVEGRLGGVEGRLGGVEGDLKDLRHRMASIEEMLEDIRAEQRLFRQAIISNFNDINWLKDRFEGRTV